MRIEDIADGLRQNAYHNWMLLTPGFTPQDTPPNSLSADPLAAGITRLSNRGVLLFSGTDAASFLQGQLTSDVAQLGAGQWRMTGYCSPKGRLLANGLIWQTSAGFAWLVSANVMEAVSKRLRMFVMRAKVTITAAEVAIFSVTGPNVVTTATSRAVEMIELPPVLGTARAFAIVETEAAIAEFVAAAAALGAHEVSDALWNWLEVRSGMGFIEVATQDRFVPQMVNLEALGGVDFKKGCFPGQEVVARSQYLGKLKRRTLLAHSADGVVPAPGADVISVATQSPVGIIVSAARAPDGSFDCLVEAPLAAWQEGLALPDRPDAALEQLALPYSLPDNEVFVRPRL
jgi:tRNA-modifying protein YgfZ